MDHLPPPIDYQKHDRVYFYAPRRQYYHPQDFFTIPEDYGFGDLQDLVENGLGASRMEGKFVNEFLQSWLWFALLAQLLNTRIRQGHFYRKDDTTLSTKELSSYISAWTKREKEDAAREADEYNHTKTSRYIRTSIALDIARRFISKHCAHDRMDRDDLSRAEPGSVCPHDGCSVDPRVNNKLALSLAILGETLQLEQPKIPFGLDRRLNFHNHPTAQAKHWGYSSYCRNKMQENKWCPSEIRRMEATLPGVSNVYLMCRMNPPEPTADHSQCTIWECVAKKPTQTAFHMGDCYEDCKLRRMNEIDLIQAVKEDKTPLITLTDANGLAYSYHDLKKDKVVPFVALTHGWQDGMFDSGKDARGKNSRSMYMCQLDMIQETCEQLLKGEKNADGSHQTYIWIDVFCFPREASVMSSGINQMRRIYSKAETVLVWDRNLIQTKKIGSAIEMNMRLTMSNWAQRLWTLQETVLAKDLVVQFEGGTVGLKDLQEAGDEAKNDVHHQYHYVWKAGHPFSSAVWKLRQTNELYRVQRLWEAVQFRLVSQPEDQTIVFANILKLNVRELEKIGNLHEDPNETAAKRMVKFLDMLDKEPGLGVPSGIIFLPPPKLDRPGYAWAPKTWLTKQAHSYPLMRPLHPAGSIMNQGFLVDFPGFILHCPRASPEEDKFHIPVQQSLHKWYKVVADRGGKGRNFKDFWENFVCTKSEPSIIMSTTHSPGERWDVGILVQTKGLLTRGEVRWVKTLCRVWVRLETNTKIMTELGNKFRNEGDAMMFGERLKSQKWCIDGDVD